MERVRTAIADPLRSLSEDNILMLHTDIRNRSKQKKMGIDYGPLSTSRQNSMHYFPIFLLLHERNGCNLQHCTPDPEFASDSSL